MRFPLVCVAADAPAPAPSGPQSDGAFRKVILDSDRPPAAGGEVQDTIIDPMELSVAKDGRVFWVERDGLVKMWKPANQETVVIGKFGVFRGLEDGLLGMTLDPNFLSNGWVYLNRSLPEHTSTTPGSKAGLIRVSRFVLRGEALDPASETPIIDVPTQREQCCHVGGSLAFDASGNLYMSIGDNTNPFESDGFAPVDERPGRSPWDAQKSASNANDLRGKIVRITPKAEGGYTIPSGNLFPPGTPKTRPEIYVMGCRNPFRIQVDQRTGYLYWGDVGPDAGGANESRGPAGHDEVNQARAAGFFGWPYFVGENRSYWHWDFVKKTNDFRFEAAKPINRSPNNTGIEELPPAQPAWISYPPGQSAKFPVLNAGGGRTAMAGPVYYFDKNLKSPHKLPEEFDRTLFIYEWSRNWITAVYLDEKGNVAKGPDGKLRMERFCPKMSFKRPMDMELGADGCLYLIEYGTAWGSNKDTQIVRIEYHADAIHASR
ncbi:MAG: PQQ-dependent sugar dehydrogenase [Verrucomicrobiales bacterium]|nr:PQQ-dependent sugar dehydrogenase [Verrucomicrobiales bacterium]